MSGTVHVERVFPVSFRPGPVVWGSVTGDLEVGDEVLLTRGDGTRATGHIVDVDFNRPADARADQFGLVIDGDIAEVVQVGDRICSVEG
jgi:hypothetical protein